MNIYRIYNEWVESQKKKDICRNVGTNSELTKVSIEKIRKDNSILPPFSY